VSGTPASPPRREKFLSRVEQIALCRRVPRSGACAKPSAATPTVEIGRKDAEGAPYIGRPPSRAKASAWVDVSFRGRGLHSLCHGRP
jgi:hypothetical protein